MKLSEQMRNPLGDGEHSPPDLIERYWLRRIELWADEVAQLEASEKTLKQINDTQSAYINELKAELETYRERHREAKSNLIVVLP